MHYTLYFVIGWSAIMFIPGWFKHDKPLLLMILIGGVIYTVGMIPFVRDKKGIISYGIYLCWLELLSISLQFTFWFINLDTLRFTVYKF